MQTKNDDWQVRKLKEVYKGYFSAIRARAKEGRPYMLRSFLSVLQHEGLGIERLDAALDKPFNLARGDGYLVLDHKWVLDVVRVESLDERIARECLLADPLTNSIPHAKACVEEMFAVQAEFLTGYTGA